MFAKKHHRDSGLHHTLFEPFNGVIVDATGKPKWLHIWFKGIRTSGGYLKNRLSEEDLINRTPMPMGLVHATLALILM